MKLGIVESEPVSETLRKRTNADKIFERIKEPEQWNAA